MYTLRITIVPLKENIHRYNTRLEDFRIFYNHTIHPELLRMERKRRRLLLLLVLSFLLIFGLFIVGIWLEIMVITLMLMLFVGVYIFVLYQRVNKFIDTFKPNIINLLTDFIDDGINYGELRYDPNKKIAQKKFLSSGIFGASPAVYEGEDYLKGTIGNVPFEMCELNVREESKVRQRLNYVFKGIFLCATVEYPLRGEVLVLPREFRQYLTRSVRQFTLKSGKPADGFIRNQDFREIWMTYATLEGVFNHVLSDDMQARLVNYYEVTGKQIYLSFQGNKIYIAVTEDKDILEPFIFRTNVSFELVREFYEDLTLLLQIVEDFDAHH